MDMAVTTKAEELYKHVENVNSFTPGLVVGEAYSSAFASAALAAFPFFEGQDFVRTDRVPGQPGKYLMFSYFSGLPLYPDDFLRMEWMDKLEQAKK